MGVPLIRSNALYDASSRDWNLDSANGSNVRVIPGEGRPRYRFAFQNLPVINNAISKASLVSCQTTRHPDAKRCGRSFHSGVAEYGNGRAGDNLDQGMRSWGRSELILETQLLNGVVWQTTGLEKPVRFRLRNVFAPACAKNLQESETITVIQSFRMQQGSRRNLKLSEDQFPAGDGLCLRW